MTINEALRAAIQHAFQGPLEDRLREIAKTGGMGDPELSTVLAGGLDGIRGASNTEFMYEIRNRQIVLHIWKGMHKALLQHYQKAGRVGWVKTVSDMLPIVRKLYQIPYPHSVTTAFQKEFDFAYEPTNPPTESPG